MKPAPTGRRRRLAPLPPPLSALAAFAVGGGLIVFILVTLLAPGPPDARGVATLVLEAATHPGPPAPADAITRQLPAGARALVFLSADDTAPGTAGPEPVSTPQVQVLRQPPDLAALERLTAAPGTVATQSANGAWVAVSLTGGGSTAPGAAAAAVAAALATAAAGWAVRRFAGPAVVVAAPPDRRAAGERQALVQHVAQLLPQMPDSLAWQATNALAAVNVRPVVPDGVRFDPASHHAIGTEATTDPARVDTIARTVRPGYVDGTHVVVYPKVVVYSAAEPEGAGR